VKAVRLKSSGQSVGRRKNAENDGLVVDYRYSMMLTISGEKRQTNVGMGAGKGTCSAQAYITFCRTFRNPVVTYSVRFQREKQSNMDACSLMFDNGVIDNNVHRSLYVWHTVIQ